MFNSKVKTMSPTKSTDVIGRDEAVLVDPATVADPVAPTVDDKLAAFDDRLLQFQTRLDALENIIKMFRGAPAALVHAVENVLSVYHRPEYDEYQKMKALAGD